MTALVLISNGTEEMEAVICIDMLRRAGITVTVAGDGDVVTCSRGVRIIPDCSIDDLNDDDTFDALVLPGGSQGVEHLQANHNVEQIVRQHHGRGGLVAAICAAPTLLHDFGLLGRSAVITSHPSAAERLAGYTYTLDRVAEDGTVITSRGAGTAFEFALAIIRRLADQTLALRVASDIVLYE